MFALCTACGPVLRDNYMGKEWLQGASTRPAIERDTRGEPLDPKAEIDQEEDVRGAVPRDAWGNPILD